MRIGTWHACVLSLGNELGLWWIPGGMWHRMLGADSLSGLNEILGWELASPCEKNTLKYTFFAFMVIDQLKENLIRFRMLLSIFSFRLFLYHSIPQKFHLVFSFESIFRWKWFAFSIAIQVRLQILDLTRKYRICRRTWIAIENRREAIAESMSCHQVFRSMSAILKCPEPDLWKSK